jgi:hypothetical protein
MSNRLKNPKRFSATAGDEYRFKIDAYTPDTMPMARLAQYMHELSQILGQPDAVHFRRLEHGSTVLVHMIEREAVPKIRDRVVQIERGDPPKEALRAYKQINKLLREDNGIAILQHKKEKDILIRFPGREEIEEKFPSIREDGSIDGRLVRIGDIDETVHIALQLEDRQLTGCWTSPTIAKQLAPHFLEQVRLFGRGRWIRDSEGAWTLSDFKIERFEPLKDALLSAALAELRAVPVGWDQQSYDELSVIRHGPGAKRDGGH